MVLYYFNHAGLFFQNLVHCLTYHKNEEVVFLNQFSSQLTPAFRNLSKVYPNIKWITEKVDIGKDVTTSQDDVKNTIVNYYEIFFKEHNIKIKECPEIYISFDNLPSFMIYLHIENIGFTFFEDKTDYHYNFVKSNFPWFEKLLNNTVLSFWKIFSERGVTRSNVKILLYSNTEKIIDNQQEKNVFDFFEATLNLPAEDKNKILKDLYNLDEVLAEFKDRDINLFLSNSYPIYRDTIGGNQINSPDTLEAYILVSYFLDFYFQNVLEVVVKLHPGCPWKGELACKSIGTNVLSQALVLAENFKVANTFSIGNTTAKLWFMKKGIPHHEIDRMKYVEIYSMLPQLDIATKAYSENISFFDKIYLHGINIDSYAEYCKFVLPDFKDNVSEKFDYNNKTFQICNAKKFKTSNYIQEDWSNLIHYVCHLHSQNGCIFIINYNFPDFQFNILNNRQMNGFGFHITIKKTQTAKEINAQLNNEHILVYCKNKELREKMFNSINGTVKELPNTGIKLEYLCENLDKYSNYVDKDKIYETEKILETTLNYLKEKYGEK